MKGSANLLFALIVYEAAFVAIFGLYSATTCSLGLTKPLLKKFEIPTASPPPICFDLLILGKHCIPNVFVYIVNFFKMVANVFVWIANGITIFIRLLTGIGMGCGYPTWYVSIIQIPILITIIYLFIPFIKG
jgi:hypothetical protein